MIYLIAFLLIENKVLRHEMIVRIDMEKPNASVASFVLTLTNDLRDAENFFNEEPVTNDISLEFVKNIAVENGFKEEDNKLLFRNENGVIELLVKDGTQYLSLMIGIKKKTIFDNMTLDSHSEVFVDKKSTQNEKKRLETIIRNAKRSLG